MHRKFRSGLQVRIICDARNSGLSTGFTSRIGPKKTILPSSFPTLNFSRSFSSFASIQIARPLTRTVARGRPGHCLRNENGGVGRGHSDPSIKLAPAHAELSPILKMRVFAASHRGELIPRVHSFARFKVWRVSEAADQSRPPGRRHILHHVRMFQALFPDSLIHGEVEILFARSAVAVRTTACCCRRLSFSFGFLVGCE